MHILSSTFMIHPLQWVLVAETEPVEPKLLFNVMYLRLAYLISAEKQNTYLPVGFTVIFNFFSFQTSTVKVPPLVLFWRFGTGTYE